MEQNQKLESTATAGNSENGQHFDYIIVGAGSAGCVVTRRLVDSGARVLLLETGGLIPNLDTVENPLRWLENIGSAHDYLYPYEPNETLNGRTIFAPRGKLVGGTGSINAMIWARGDRQDYDRWAELSSEKWSYDEVLPFFKKTEDWEFGEDGFHGQGGPIAITTAKGLGEIDRGFIEAAKSFGYPYDRDLNRENPYGASPEPLTVRDGKRSSPFTGYLQPVLNKTNLRLEHGARTTRLIIDDDKICRGVEYTREGVNYTAFADQEVIVSTGTFESPRLLMLSGIGDQEDLKSLGIDPVVHLPGVGKNLQDHPLLSITFEASVPVGPFTNNLGGSIMYAKSDAQRTKSDLMFIPIQYPVQSAEIMAKHPIPENSFSLFVNLVDVQSSGDLRLTSAEPDAPLQIQPNILQAPEDMEAMIKGVELALQLAEEPALRKLIKRWIAPAEFGDRESLEAFIKDACGTYFHPTGTCAMGNGPLAVVDPELKVRGIHGLRVADASVMPMIPSANTNAPTLMIGEFLAYELLSK
jgi:choline dehydrogenase